MKLLFRLWSLYFHLGALEGDGRVYERIGIRRVGRFMMGGYYSSLAFNRLRGRRHRTPRGKRAAVEWLVFTMVAELGHLFFFIVMVVIAARAAAAGRWSAALAVALVNIVINLIPMMVQRYNRARIVTALSLDAAKVIDPRFWNAALTRPGGAAGDTRA